MRLATCLLALALSPVLHAAETRIPDTALDTAAQLREQALADGTAWDVVESLTTEVGPRLAGSEADARAVKWAEAKFKALGYDKVWLEPVSFPKWVRRSESAAVVGDHADLVGREHLLVGLSVRAREDRAQRLVAQDDVAHGGLECQDVDAPVHPPCDGHVVHAAASSELVEDPQALLRVRQRHHRRSRVGRDQRGSR